jgi:cytochrome c oxidase subunit 2
MFFQQASNINDKVDNVFLGIFALSALFLIGITATMIYFVVRYSRQRNPHPENIEGNTALEIAWTVIPLILFLGMFYFGWTNYRYMRNPPRDALVVEATARQWSWSFKYPNGRVTSDLYAALERPVKVELRSLDVVHGFFVPAFRVKSDVVPGQTNFVWFTPQLLGSFDIECTVICGVDHARMLAKVHVVPEQSFKEWYFGPEEASLPEPRARPVAVAGPPSPIGAASPANKPAGLVLLENGNCLLCHTLDGTVGVGPGFKGRFGTRDVVGDRQGEREIELNEAYYRRAIVDPQAEIVRGYPPTMPKVQWTDAQVRTAIEYLKTIQ